MRRLPLLALPLAMIVLSGCTRYGGGVMTGFALGAAIAASAASHEPDPPPAPVVITNVYVVREGGPTARAPAGPLPPRERAEEAIAPPRPFDATAARTALHAVDLAACKESGAPRGYGHAKVTFDGAGKVTRILIDAPSGLGDAAVACIGERFRPVEVPAFDGGEMTAGVSFFVP